LQQVLNEAVPGDTITLQAGATFTGAFTLPKKERDRLDYDSKFAILTSRRPARWRVGPWVVIEDVTLTNNVIRHVGGVFNILAKDYGYGAARRIIIP